MNRPDPYEEGFFLDIWENWTWNPWLAFKRWMGKADTEALKREVERLKGVVEANLLAIHLHQQRADHYKAALTKIQLQAYNAVRYKNGSTDLTPLSPEDARLAS
jgi:hypothetical protein